MVQIPRGREFELTGSDDDRFGMCLRREGTSKGSGEREQTAIGKNRVSTEDDFCDSRKKGVDGGIGDEEGRDAGG